MSLENLSLTAAEVEGPDVDESPEVDAQDFDSRVEPEDPSSNGMETVTQEDVLPDPDSRVDVDEAPQSPNAEMDFNDPDQRVDIPDDINDGAAHDLPENVEPEGQQDSDSGDDRVDLPPNDDIPGSEDDQIDNHELSYDESKTGVQRQRVFIMAQ